MSQELIRNINVGVSKECWKKLKILSVQKEITLAELVKDILEKFTNKKSIDAEEK